MKQFLVLSLLAVTNSKNKPIPGNNGVYFQGSGLGSIQELRDHEHTKPPEEIVSDDGYPIETHTVRTEDGYILNIHRIPHSRGESYNASRPTVFLQHGLLSSSADWVIMGPETSLAYLLSDAGYDVWMGNYRGNTYSHQHSNQDISKKDYWTFSWDEMARYDLPCMLTRMMEVTGQPRFYYVGHSMGTLSYFTACNYHPWIADATKLFVGYGPHTVVSNMTSPVFTLLSKFVNNIQWIMNLMGMYEFLPSNYLMEWLASVACDEEMVTQALCKSIMFMMCGYNENEMNNTALPYIIGHTPAGTSTWNMVHYAQSANNEQWQGLDYGSDEMNLEHWNSTTPPVYSYDAVSAPTALYWGDNDWLVVPEDTWYMADRLPNVVENHRVGESGYTHLDFLWGIHNPEILYGPTMELMKKY